MTIFRAAQRQLIRYTRFTRVTGLLFALSLLQIPQVARGQFSEVVKAPTISATEGTISVSDLTLNQGATGTAQLSIETGSTALAAFAFTLEYDPHVACVVSCSTLSNPLFEAILCNADYDADGIPPDSIRINGIAPQGFSGSASLGEIEFCALGRPGSASQLVVASDLYADVPGFHSQPETSSGRISIVARPDLQTVSPSSVGGPGSVFTLEGQHFAPDSSYDLSINRIECCPVTTDHEGRFRISLVTPTTIAPGYYQLSLSQELNAFASFRIELDAPIQPPISNGGMHIFIDEPPASWTLLYIPIMVAQ